MSNDDHITAAQYRAEISDLAEIVVGRVQEHGQDVNEVVWEEIDSHQWVIYTPYHLDVLKHSEEGPHEFKHLIDDTADWREVIQMMAYKAMENDLYAELRDQHGDIL